MPIDVGGYGFALPVDDIFNSVSGGIIAVGRISKGSINVNDTVKVLGHNTEIITAKVVRIHMFRKEVTTANTGDNIGLELEGINRNNLSKGYYIAK